MCDYSLEMYASRPARVGERYETTRFASGSIGLAVPGDATCAICLQYDTPLVLESLPAHVRGQDGPDRVEAVFTRVEGGAYHDAVAFPDGRTLSLQQLGVGVTVQVKELLAWKMPSSETAAHEHRRPALAE